MFQRLMRSSTPQNKSCGDERFIIVPGGSVQTWRGRTPWHWDIEMSPRRHQKIVILLGFGFLEAPCSHFRSHTSQSTFCVSILINWFFMPPVPPISVLIACSSGMLKVTQGLVDLFAFMRRSVCWEWGILTYRGASLVHGNIWLAGAN